MLFLSIILICVIGVCVLLSPFVLFGFRWSKGGPVLWVIKSFVLAVSFYVGLIALVCLIAGFVTGLTIVLIPGIYCVLVYFGYLARIAATDSAGSFKRAFGDKWKQLIPGTLSKHFIKHPLSGSLPDVRQFVFEQNVCFATIPDSNRQLGCDLWLPSKKVDRSGLAFIYLHGGAWYYLDKDFATRPLFRHLASQGHVVMDVAYRLFPETDMKGMIHDAKRAVNWMKQNAGTYRINVDKIVIGGGSAGAHIALMTGYLPDEEQMTPPELSGADLSVRAVISAYGPPDLEALYYYTDQQITTKNKQEHTTGPKTDMKWMQQMMGKDYMRLGYNKPAADAGALAAILGCHPDECPDLYRYYSPVSHVSKACPPTLLLQGAHDMFTPLAATKALYKELEESGVPAVIHVLPQTDHGFDLFLPKISPVAHIAFYDIERFLALMCSDKCTGTTPGQVGL